MQRRTLFAATAVAAFGPAVAAQAATKVVYAGGTAKFARTLGVAGIDNFLINRVTIRLGDTVKWNGSSLAGGFHTVDIPASGGKTDITLVIPTGKPTSEIKDASGSDFWFDGKLPALTFNPALFGPSGGNAYTGTVRIDSGLPLGPPHDFAVKFNRTGTFKYFCDVHPGMVGYVVVKPRSAKVPTKRQDAAELSREQSGFAKEAKKVAATPVPAATVRLGQAGPGGVELFAMYPSKLTVKPGTTVTFTMPAGSEEVHSATFGPAAYLAQLGSSFAKPGGPPSIDVYPSEPGPIVLTPTTHGNGFASTGLLDRDPATPQKPTGQITFTKAGTYKFFCVVHAFMRGTIVVK